MRLFRLLVGWWQIVRIHNSCSMWFQLRWFDSRAGRMQASSAVRAQTISLGDSQDVSIASGGGLDSSNLATNEFLVNWFGATSSQGLIQFDLSTVPSNAVITSASLTLFHEFNSGNGNAYN